MQATPSPKNVEAGIYDSSYCFVFAPRESWHGVKWEEEALRCKAGAIIFAQDDRADAAFLIEEGLIKLTRLEEDGQEIITGVAAHGMLPGYTAVLLNTRYAATAKTLNQCVLRRIEATKFRSLIQNDLQFSWRFHQWHCRLMYQSTAQRVALQALSARQRVELFLWELVSLLMPNENSSQVKLALPLKHWEMAYLIGITPEHFSRLLHDLKKDDLIIRDREGLVFTNPSRLWHQTEYFRSFS